MKRGFLVLVFLFVVACFLPFAMAPPAQASGTVVQNDHATIIAGPAVQDRFDLANGMLAEATNLNDYIDMSNKQKTHGVWDTSLTTPWTRSLEVSETLKYPEELAGTKSNANNHF